MPDLSYHQSLFWGGEWSPNFRGRTDDKDYIAALSLCLNYIPNQEGSLSPRSGFKRIGSTRSGSPAKLLASRFSNWLPYVTEFTGGNLRLWANGQPLYGIDHAALVSVAGSPPTFTIIDTRAGVMPVVPPEWATGNRIMIQATGDFADLEGDGGTLVNREFILTIVSASAGTVRLTDAITGMPLLAAITLAFPSSYKFFRILDIPTPYMYIEDVRQVQFTSQRILTSGGEPTGSDVASMPDHRVCFLKIANSPRSLVYDKANAPTSDPAPGSWVKTTLVKEKFIDGPYLDSLTTTVPGTVSGTTGTITVRLHAWNTLAIYRSAATVWDGTSYFVSLVTNNKGNALPTWPTATAFWASIPKAWNSGTTYFLGQPAYFGQGSNGVFTIYYSLQAGNTNHTPPNLTWWDTTPAAYAGGSTYSDGAVASFGGLNYVSLVGANTGNQPDISPTFWLPVDLETALDAIQNTSTGWPAQGQFFNNDTGTANSSANQPRLFRMKATPGPWNTQFTYSTSDYVNYKDNIYKALASTTGDIPDQETTKWELQTKTIFWTWGEITAVTDNYTASILIKGDDLPNSNPIWEWRFGVYSDTTGWPTCGTYHEGRLWLAGAQPNRFDAGRSNLGFDFSPTASDGTVADNNAMAYVLNAEESETIQSMASTEQGIVMFTDEAEWLVSASAMNDPLTPTSIQAHRTTRFSSAPIEVTHLPNALAVVQNGGRRVLEYRTFIDERSYQARLNTVDLTRKCQHLTGDSVLQTAYQSLPQPVLWGVPGGIVTATPQLSVCPIPAPEVTQTHKSATGTLFGLGYSRTPDASYVAPFSFEHGWSLSTGVQKQIGSIAVQKGLLSTAEYLYVTVLDEFNAHYYVEMLMPVFESTPLADTYANDGTVASFGTLSSAYFVDSGVTPVAAKIASNGLSVTFYGMKTRAGETLQFTCRGKYVGNYTIAPDGTAVVTFTTTFTKTDVGRAMYVNGYNATLLPTVLQRFYLDTNGVSGVDEPSTVSDFFYGQFGYAYRRRGQMLRPPIAGRNGPAFAKLRQNARIGIYLDAGQEVSVGNTFDAANLKPFKLTTAGPNGKIGKTAPTAADFVTGIFRQQVDDDYTFDGNLCWEQTRPVPGGILGVGGFLEITDV